MKCKDCKWWVLQDDTPMQGEKDYGSGECRRYPPVRDYENEEQFPWTYMDTWCGEFEETPK